MARGGYRPGAGKPPVLSDVSADDPLGFLLEVMKDTSQPLTQRIKAAGLAAPYFHEKAAEQGKKAKQVDAAVDIASEGRFTAVGPPKLVAKRA